MRQGLQSAMVLTAGLLAACATGAREVRDEGSERIEEAMRPEPHPEVIPEGIALGNDAPPLAPAEPEVASPSMLSGGLTESLGWGYGGPFLTPGPVYGPWSPGVRYHLKPMPGGSIPGLLP